MAAALLLFSCAKDEAQGDSQRLPIELTAAGLGTVTRAGNNLNTPTNFFDGTTDINFTVAVDGTNYTYKTNNVNVNMTSSSPAYFPVNGNSVSIMAYYPANKMQYAASAQTFTVEADQSTDAKYKDSDLMYGLPVANGTYTWGTWNGLDASGKVKPTTSAIPMEFVHKMSKITVNVTINGAVVKTITMKNIKRSIDFDPADGTLSNLAAAGSGTSDEVIMYSNSTGTSTDFVTAAIIPEQDPTTGTEFIDVVIQDSPSDKTLTYKLQEDGNFESGKQYVYNLTVSNDEILCTTSITNWDDVTLTPAQQGDGLAVLKNIKLNPLWYVAEKNLASSTSFASDISSPGYFFTWQQAMTNFAASTTSYTEYANVGKLIDGERWHLPVAAEWMSIFPVGATNVITLDSDNGGGGFYRTGGGVWGFNETTKAGVSDPSYWVTVSSTEAHAIRFLGTDYCSAWKYELLGGFSSSNYGYLKVSSTLIDKVEDSKASAAEWYTNNFNSVLWDNDYDNGAVQRVFYACGRNSGGNAGAANAEQGEAGRYWSTTVNSSYSASAISVYFLIISGQGTLVLNQNGAQYNGFPVRLFRDN